jgi:hypothetical protein
MNAAPARIAETHAHLTGLDPTGGAAVLAVAPDRMRAFLHKAGRIEHEHRLWILKVRHDRGAQVVAPLIRLPPGGIEQPLDAIRAVLSKPCGDLPAIFALTGRESRTQRAERPAARRDSAEPWGDTAVPLFKLLLPLLNHPHHERSLLGAW